ncbi:TetR/AcrR family transcriptional regulator [Nonomuraea soli]|uniref:AcrR family transcriptional regulator n=1 Tax=Nonomuraea soli TaxID=1032476 RepID=A0A7W0HW85_9ACTN|nr:TetR/AcrR family transcriptional regulator C-terminal domain-containing protein [Nonomuraea soli]MBA2897998.1 AcrR family transcriptional regulator [Nonomuraea soli]
MAGQQWRVLGRPRGRPASITRAAIADAALAVGFEHLTMAAVADRLEVSHSALYRHVRNRHGLVMLAVDRALQRVSWPSPTGSWRADLEAQARALWGLLEGHPGLMREFLKLRGFPREIMLRFGSAVRQLVEHGFAPEEAFLAVDTVFDLTIDVFTRGEQLDAPARDEQLDAPARDKQPDASSVREATAGAWADAVGAELAPLMRRALAEPAALWFERKLALVLDGIAARHDRS